MSVKAKGTKTVPTRTSKAKKVLVVDDEPAVLSTYRLILEQSGYDTVAAATSREAIQAIGEHDFDLILSDFSLEQQHTGFEVIEGGKEKDDEEPCGIRTG